MDIATVTDTIGLILAPVVIITACAIVVGGFWNHYAAISDRLRTLTRERLELLREDAIPDVHTPTHAYVTERLAEIGGQLPDLLRRLRFMRDAVLATYTGVGLLVLDMFAIALAVETGSSLVATLALGLFLLGTTGLFVGTLLAVFEVRASHRAVSDEARRVAAIDALDAAPPVERQNPVGA